MNSTPKYAGGATRSLSPLRSATKQRYYSAEEVNRIVRASFEPKIQHLVDELEARQQAIGRLNNQLHANDQKLLQQAQVIEAYARRAKDSQHSHQLPAIVAQVVGEKTKQLSEAVGRQLQQIASQLQHRHDWRQVEARVGAEVEALRVSTAELMDGWKRKSNAYWQKVKEALGRMNSKVTACEKDLLDLGVRLDNLAAQRKQEGKALEVVRGSRPLLGNLVQLKKSVDNIYQNYQHVLKLQRTLKQRVEQGAGDSLWSEGGPPEPRLAHPESLVALEYSQEEGRGQEEWPSEHQANSTQPIVSPLRHQGGGSPEGLLGQRGQGGQAFSDSSFSLNTSQNNPRSQNSTVVLNLSLEARREMWQGVRERLAELIEAKGLPRPLPVRYDSQINYLKSAEGNYLFDLRGNMFKVVPGQLAQLQEEGLVLSQPTVPVQHSQL